MPATSANRILQQLGGVLGIVVLALILQHDAATNAAACPGPAATATATTS
jgi:hypothetical protein